MEQDWRKAEGSTAEWIFQFRSPTEIYKTHSSYIISEFFLYFSGGLVLLSAFREGGRAPFVWFGAVIHGLVLEMLCYYIPDVDNFWQSHSSIMMFGHRYPLHIFFLYAYFISMGMTIARRLKLRNWAEPFAAGLIVLLLDLPYDITGVKLLWWTWHDTDPSIYDRFYWAPWTSFIFHLTFTLSFWCLFNGLHKVIAGGRRTEYRGFVKEFIVMVLTGTFTATGGILCFLMLYHPLHDFYGIHTENICIFILSFYLLIVFKSERRREVPLNKEKQWFDEIAFLAFFNCIFYTTVSYLADPANISSQGYYETIGPCNETFVVQTMTGPVTRAKYLCPTSYRSSDYFNFKCVSGKEQAELMRLGEGIGQPRSWYTVCGTPFRNRAEYLTMVWVACILSVVLFYELLSRSRPVSKQARPRAAHKSD